MFVPRVTNRPGSHAAAARWVAVLSVLFFAGLCYGEEAAPTLPAESIPFDGGTIILDKALLEHREWVVDTVERDIQAAKQARTVDQAALQRTATAMTDTALQLLGLEEDDALREAAWTECFDELHRSESPGFVLPDHVTVFILNSDTSKDFLRNGGTIPFVSYNAKEDRATIAAKGSIDQADVPLPNITVIEGAGMVGDKPFSADSLSEMLGLYLSWKHMLSDKWADAQDELPPNNPRYPQAALSMVEAAWKLGQVIVRERTSLLEGEHTIWFTNGFNVTFGERVLEAIGAERAATLAREMRSLEVDPAEGDPADLHQQIYLRYQSRTSIRFETSEYDASLADIRLALNATEVDRLLDHIGTERLPTLLRVLRDERIDNGIDLEATLRRQFGYDISARLDRYQPQGDAQALYDALIARFFDERNAGQNSAMAHTLNRAHEIQIGDQVADRPAIYKMLLAVLEPLHAEHVGHVMVANAWWEVATRQREPSDHELFVKLTMVWVKHAVGSGHLEHGYQLLTLLEEQPIDFDALGYDGRILKQLINLVRASKLIDDDRLDDAQKMVESIRRDFPKDAKDHTIDAYLTPNLEALEMRIHTRRPQAPALG
jgi:hypothetical protein